MPNKQRLFFSMQIRIQLSQTLSGFRIQEEKLNADPDPQPWYKKIMSTYPIGSVWRPGKRPSGRAVGSVRARSGHTWTTARSTASCAYSCQEYPCSRGDGQSKKLYLKKNYKNWSFKEMTGTYLISQLNMCKPIRIALAIEYRRVSGGFTPAESAKKSKT